MPAKVKTGKPEAPKKRRKVYDDSESVTDFLRALEHPMKPLIEVVRQVILETDKSITEGIKWNTVSFYCCGWFATVNLRSKTGVQIVLHQGAKIRDDRGLRDVIDDPSHCLTWLAKDRATATFATAKDLKNGRAAFKQIIKQWVRCQQHLSKMPAALESD